MDEIIDSLITKDDVPNTLLFFTNFDTRTKFSARVGFSQAIVQKFKQ